LTRYITAHAKESGGTSQGVVIPDASDDASLRVKGKRTKVDTDSEDADAKAKKQKVAKSEATNYDSGKVAKSEATNYDSGSASTPKRKRDSSITAEAAKLALEEMDAEEQRASKKKPSGVDFVCPMFEMTPEMAQRAKEHADKLNADKRRRLHNILLKGMQSSGLLG